MISTKTTQRVVIDFLLPNGEGFRIEAPLYFGDETNKYITLLLEELDRAGTAFILRGFQP